MVMGVGVWRRGADGRIKEKGGRKAQKEAKNDGMSEESKEEGKAKEDGKTGEEGEGREGGFWGGKEMNVVAFFHRVLLLNVLPLTSYCSNTAASSAIMASSARSPQ